MRNFVVPGTKFSAHGFSWIAEPLKRIYPNTGVEEHRQIWKSKKTWLAIQCCYDIHRETITWKVDRYSTAKTRSGAAALAASMTRESLDRYVDLIALYGDEIEKRYGKMILKKKGHVNIEEHVRNGEVKF